MPKIKAIYDKGTAEQIEDGLIINPPFFGVVDGTSEPSHFIGKGLSFGKMSSGEMVRKIILGTFYSAKSNESLERITLQVNRKIRNLWCNCKIPLNRSDLITGAAFSFIKIGPKKINILQGGDCFALWMNASGKAGITKNQVYLHEFETQKIIAELMKKYKGNRKKMWENFYKPLGQFRLRDINKTIETGYALLNGQLSLRKCWQKIDIPVSGLKFLLLFTDGFVPFKKEEELAKEIVKLYGRGGLDYILKKKREFEKATEKKSYRVYDEATAIALKFDKIS